MLCASTTDPTCSPCFVPLLLVCSYYLPAPLRQHLKETMPQQGNFETKYQLLFSVVLFSGIFLPLIGGIVVDRIGGGICLLVLATSCFVGHIIASVGVQRENWAVLLTGRFIYGLGVECEIVAIQALLTEWFGIKRIGMAMALTVAIAYIGFFTSFLLGPFVANRVDVAFSFWLGAMVKGVSVIAALFIFVLSRGKRASSQVDETRNSGAPRDAEVPAETSDDAREARSILRSQERKASKVCLLLYSLKFNLSFWLLCVSRLIQYSVNLTFYSISSGALLEQYLFVESDADCYLEHPDQCSSGYLAPANGNPARDPSGALCSFGEEYAPVLPSSINITATESSWDKTKYVYSPLKSDDVDCTDDFWSEACTSNYCDEQEKATEKAGVLMSIPSIVLVTTIYLFGKYCGDRAGLRCEMIVLAPILVAIAQSMFAYSETSPIVPLILQGLGYSLVASSLWAAIPFAVPETSLGRAFGLAMCIQNIGLTIFPLIAAAIYNTNDRYLPEVSIFFLGCAVAAIIVALVLLFWDKRTGGKLRARGGLSPGSIHTTPSGHSLHSNHSSKFDREQPLTLKGSLTNG